MDPPPAHFPPSAAKLEIDVKPLAPDLVEVRLPAEFARESVSCIQRVFERLFADRIFRILLNLEETTYIDSIGAGLLLWSSESARSQGGSLILVGTNPRIHQHLTEFLGLTDTLQFAPSVEEALKRLAPERKRDPEDRP